MWNSLDEIFLSLIATVIGVLATTLFGCLRKAYRLRGQRRFWGPVIKNKSNVAVVLTDKPGTSPRSPKKISLTDVQAYSDIRTALHELGREVELKAGSQADIRQLSNDSFISLGGPRNNGITDNVLQSLGQNLPVAYDKDRGEFVYSGKSYAPELDAAGKVVRDFGLIVRLIKLNPSAANSHAVLIAFGIHGHGTGQAVRAIVSDKPLRKALSDAKEKDFWALLEFEFENHNPLGFQVIASGTMNRG